MNDHADDSTSNKLLKKQTLPVVEKLRGDLGMPRTIGLERDLRGSDHAPFWGAAISTGMLTGVHNFPSPFYHAAMELDN